MAIVQKYRYHIIIALLVLSTCAVYWQLTRFWFMSVDDGLYVVENPNIREGLTWRTFLWSFKPNYQVGNWHPLTWLSLQLDYTISGPDAGAFHLTNVLLHTLAAVLLFLALDRMTGATWRSAFVAGIFALHPLHVESVAWIAERKDVLSGVFWMLTMLAYARFASQPTARRWVLVLILFALGLMAKPMLVSLPIVLLLLDYWPLERMGTDYPCSGRPPGRPDDVQTGSGRPPGRPDGGPTGIRPLLIEKTPLFALSAASCVITLVVQRGGGATSTPESMSFGIRLANAAHSYVAYIFKAIWPARLAVIYPHPRTHLPEWQVIASAAALLLITLLAIRFRKKSPWLLVGWLWYVVTLIPVIGLVQVGIQGMADRYTYIPLIGLSLIVAWAAPGAFRKPHPVISSSAAAGSRNPLHTVISSSARNLLFRAAPSICALVILVALGVVAHHQVGYWRSEITLFSHALDVTSRNYLAHDSLGVAYYLRGDNQQAIRHFREALRIEPRFSTSHYNLANVLAKLGKPAEAEAHLRAAIKHTPDYSRAHTDLGALLLKKGDLRAAERHLRQAIRLNPADHVAHNNLGIVLIRRGRVDEAISHFERAVELDPTNRGYRRNYDNARAYR